MPITETGVGPEFFKLASPRKQKIITRLAHEGVALAPIQQKMQSLIALGAFSTEKVANAQEKKSVQDDVLATLFSWLQSKKLFDWVQKSEREIDRLTDEYNDRTDAGEADCRHANGDEVVAATELAQIGMRISTLRTIQKLAYELQDSCQQIFSEPRRGYYPGA